jgi:putative oxidoreductase
LIIGLLTRLAAIVLLIDISVAIISTKIPVLLGYGFWGFSLMKLPRYGFWSMMHEARTDFSMWLGLLFLVIVGAGRWSVDAALMRRPDLNGQLRRAEQKKIIRSLRGSNPQPPP